MQVEFPSHSGNMANLKTVAGELRKRLTAIFTKDNEGKRNVNSQTNLFNSDEHFKDLVLFYEFFNGDTGKGVGASYQTGWTGVIGKRDMFSKNTKSYFLILNYERKLNKTI